MGTVITVMNMKGGVGKTTLCAHIGGLLGRRRSSPGGRFRSVLMIDYDPQFNLSQAFLRSRRYFELERDGRTCLRVLQDANASLDPFVIQTPTTAQPPGVGELAESIYRSSSGIKVDLISSTLDLMYIALGTSTGDLAIVEERFRAFIDECRSAYDVVLIDCHPAGSILTRTSLRNSDHVLIPVTPQAYAMRGVALMMKFIDANRLGNMGPVPHIILNLIPRSGALTDIEMQVRKHAQFSKHCLTTTLKKYKVFSEPEEGLGFVWTSGKPYSIEALRNLRSVVDEISVRLGI